MTRTSAARSPTGPLAEPVPHYLKEELYALIKSDSSIFDFLQSGSLDGIWYWDLDHPEHEWMSERFWSTFGHDPTDMPHSPDAWQHMIDPDDLALALDNFKRHCDDPDHPYDQVVRYRHRNGSTVWVRCRGIAIRDARGAPVRMLGAHSDITSTKLAEQELHEKNEQLVVANAELARFAFAASHDLQTPIRALNGILDALAEDHREQLDEEGMEMLDMALTSANRVRQLTEGILQYVRIGGARDDFEAVNCTDLVADILSDYRDQVEEGRIRFDCEPLPVVQGLEMPIRQVFQNLIGNALKFSGAGSETSPVHVRIGVRPDAEHWHFFVEDDGIGIEEAFSSRIFDAFSQVHTKSEYEGVGLGLALCRHVVGTHGGRIWVESTPGEGATFHFTLHRDPSSDEAP